MERRALVVLMSLPALSKSRILALARAHRGNVAAMTAAAGLSRSTMDRRIRALAGLREILATRYPRKVRQPRKSGTKEGQAKR